MISYPNCIIQNIKSAEKSNMESFQDAYDEYSMLVEVFNNGTLEETKQWLELYKDDDLAWQSIGKIMMWNTDKEKINAFFQILNDDIADLPDSDETKEYIKTLTQKIHIPVFHPEIALDWLKTHYLRIENAYIPNPKSLLAACIEDPDFVLNTPWTGHLDLLLSEPVILKSSEDMKRVLRAFDKHLMQFREQYRNVMMSGEINSESPGLGSWLTIHIMHTWSLEDIKKLLEPWKPYQQESFLRARSYLSTNDRCEPLGEYDLSDDLQHLQQLSHWLYPEYTRLVDATPKTMPSHRTTFLVEELFANPEPRLPQLLKQHFYKNNPQFAYPLFVAMDICSNEDGIELSAMISNVYKDSNWRKLALQCRQKDSLEPMAQWICEQILPGSSWKDMQEQVALVKSLNEHWSTEQIWKMSIAMIVQRLAMTTHKPESLPTAYDISEEIL